MRIMTRSDIYMLIGVSVICILLSMTMGKCSRTEIQTKVETDTVFQERIDTIHLTHTVTRYRPHPTRTDTIFVTDTLTNEVVQDKIINVYEGNDSVVNQNDTLSPPMSVKYHWYVRNVNCDLDSLSIDIDVPQRTRMLEITKEVTKYKTKHWGLTVGVGVGYSPCMKAEPFIGVMWGYRF